MGRTAAGWVHGLPCERKAVQPDCSAHVRPWHVGSRAGVHGARNALLTASPPPAVLRNSGLQAGLNRFPEIRWPRSRTSYMDARVPTRLISQILLATRQNHNFYGKTTQNKFCKSQRKTLLVPGESSTTGGPSHRPPHHRRARATAVGHVGSAGPRCHRTEQERRRAVVYSARRAGLRSRRPGWPWSGDLREQAACTQHTAHNEETGSQMRHPHRRPH